MIAVRILGTLMDSLRKAFPARTRAASSMEQPPAPPVLVCRTHDEVNAELARAWCEDHGLDCQLASGRDPLLPDRARALVIDVNHLDLDSRQRGIFLERLCQTLPPYPVVIASYEVSPELRARFLARGWLIFRYVESRLFYELTASLSWASGAC
jgi:hypothetical protein